MPSLNQCMFIGHLGRDPEMRFTPNGNLVASFSLAVSNRYKSGDEWKESTEWVNVVVWGKQAEYVNEHLNKGNLAFVQGRLQTRSWEDKEGQKQYRTEVVADRVQNLTRTDKVKGEEAEEEEDKGLPF